ncbi:MAG: hypothetical protein ABG776_08245 [Cyanobacteria bacterium J06555_13]
MKRPNWRYIVPMLAVGVSLSTAVSFVVSVDWMTPILGAAIAYPIFLYFVSHEQYGSAAVSMLLWAVFQSLAIIIGTIWFPETAAEVILSGPTATAEMFHWIQTGEGAEGALRLFLPIHLRNYVIFCGLCCLTISSAALLFGTWLLNYMNFYVAELVRASVYPWIAILLGWPPWSILRMIGFILTGIALAVVGLNLRARLRRRSNDRVSFPTRYLQMGIGFVVADIVVKATLAPFWQQLLHYALVGKFE